MSLLDQLSQEAVWNAFYEYKQSLACPKQFTGELRAFIDAGKYRQVCERIQNGEPFPLPERAVLNKLGAKKKRVVYTYPEPENTVLKLLTWLLLRQYNDCFSPGLYSFRPGCTAKDAVRRLLKRKDIFELYAYKADVHDYFNSIPVERLLPVLKKTLAQEPELYRFLESLLTEPFVLEQGQRLKEQKGIMAGTPLSAFYANLFLAELDRSFAERRILYARYSDDILVFGRTGEEREAYAEEICRFLTERSLAVNPDKEERYAPGDGFTFLGFLLTPEAVDIAPATVTKLKQKMRRKRDALARWKKRSEAEGERAARAFIRMFNRKLLESSRDNELGWSSWFFPVISTSDSLHEIDLYAQDCIRYLVSGRHTKARFNVRYEDLKRMGYRSLVHEFYKPEVPAVPADEPSEP